MTTAIELWGKDHWSTLAYVESRVINQHLVENPSVGALGFEHMRCNTDTHPLLARSHHGYVPRWDPNWGTRLKGFQDRESTPELILLDHDDWDCLDDMADAGLVEIISLVNGFVRLTPRGSDICQQLSGHKHRGGTYATFEPILTWED